MVRRRAPLLAALLLGACAEFSSKPTPGGGESDAAADAVAPLDADVPDASVASPCKGIHAFCADFDDGLLNKGWTEGTNVGPGTIDLTTLARSAPRAMRATSPRKAATETETWYRTLNKYFDGWKRTVFEADVFLAGQAWELGDNNFSAVQLSFRSGSSTSGTVFFVQDGAGGASVEHVPVATRYTKVTGIPYGRWVHLLIDFDPGGHFRYVIDGQVSERDFPPVTAGLSPTTVVQVGILSFNSPTPAIDIRWDNVVIDFP